MGRMLVSEPVIVPADVIIVSLSAGGAGTLEAADLVDSRMAQRVAVFTDPPRDEDLEFLRRGLPYEDASSRQIEQLKWLNVTSVATIPGDEAGSTGEVSALRAWCSVGNVRSVIFVVRRDHSRRLRRAVARAMKDQPTIVTVQPARHSGFDPANWWQSRDSVRTAIVEWQKLLLDILLHPLPS